REQADVARVSVAGGGEVAGDQVQLSVHLDVAAGGQIAGHHDVVDRADLDVVGGAGGAGDLHAHADAVGRHDVQRAVVAHVGRARAQGEVAGGVVEIAVAQIGR